MLVENEVKSEVKKERVVNIIGLGISAETTPDTGENWVLNIAYKRIPHLKIDKMFFMDNWNVIMDDDQNILVEKQYNFEQMVAKNPDVEIFSRFSTGIKNPQGEILTKVNQFPLHEAVKLIPGGYFTSTIAYAIVYAILQKVDRIRLYGMEIWAESDANEYNYQRPCVDFWLAYALGRGIKVEIPYYLSLTAINQQNYYGFFKGELKQNELRRK